MNTFEEYLDRIKRGEAREVLKEIDRQLPHLRFSVTSRSRKDPSSLHQDLLTLFRLQGIAYFYLDDMDSSAAAFKEMARLARKWNHVRGEIEAYIGLGTTFAVNYRLIRAKESLQKGLLLAKQHGLEDYLPAIHSNLSHVLRLLGDLDAAERLLQEQMSRLHLPEALKDLRQHSTSTLERIARILGNYSRVLQDRGEIEQALRYLMEIKKISDLLGVFDLKLASRFDLATLMVEVGNLEAARQLLQEAEELVNSQNPPTLLGQVLLNKLACVLKEESFHEAESILQQLQEWLHLHPNTMLQIHYLMTKIEYHVLRSRRERATKGQIHMDAAFETLSLLEEYLSQERLAPELAAQYHLTAAMLYLETNNLETALMHAETAHQLFNNLQQLGPATRMLLILALIHALIGDHHSSSNCLDAVKQVITQRQWTYLERTWQQIQDEVHILLKAHDLFTVVLEKNPQGTESSSSENTVRLIQEYIQDVQKILE